MQNLKISLVSYLHTADITVHLILIDVFLWSLYYIYPIMDKILLTIKSKIKNAKVLMKKYKASRFIVAIFQITLATTLYYWISQHTFIEKLKLQNNANFALILIFVQLFRFTPMFINGIILGKEIEPFVVWQYIVKMFIISYVSTISLPILLSNLTLGLLVPILESINLLVGKSKKIEENGLFPKYKYIKHIVTFVEFSNISNDLLNIYEIMDIVRQDVLFPIFLLNITLLLLMLFYNVWHVVQQLLIRLINFYINNEEEQEHMQNESVGNGYNYQKISKINNQLQQFVNNINSSSF